MTGNVHVAYSDINPAEFHLANPGNCLNNRSHLSAESAIEAVGSMRRVVGTAEEQSRMAQQLQMINGHGQQLATQPETLVVWKKRKHDDFACGDVAETVPNQRRVVLCDESQQLTLSYLT